MKVLLITIILIWVLLVPFAQIADIRDNFLGDEDKTFWYYFFQNFIEAGLFTLGLLTGTFIYDYENRVIKK